MMASGLLAAKGEVLMAMGRKKEAAECCREALSHDVSTEALELQKALQKESQKSGAQGQQKE